MTVRNLVLAALAVSVTAVVAVPAFADADDAKWIKQCMKDNADQGQPATVIAAYCSCMNNKMSSNETRSITEWEKSHPREEKACSKEAGWK